MLKLRKSDLENWLRLVSGGSQWLLVVSAEPAPRGATARAKPWQFYLSPGTKWCHRATSGVAKIARDCGVPHVSRERRQIPEEVL